MALQQPIPRGITLTAPISLPYSYKKLAVENFKQAAQSEDTGYYLSFLFLHMHIEDLLFQNFATIQFSARAGISKVYRLDENDRKTLARDVKRSNLIRQLKLLDRQIEQLDIQGSDFNDRTLLTAEEKPNLQRFIDTRNYLTHALPMTNTLLRQGGVTIPLQSGNAKDDLLDAFRMTIVLEHRLTSTLRHIENTLFDCVCSGHSHTVEISGKDFTAFTFHVFKSSDFKFRTVVSRHTTPMPKISEVAKAWKHFESFRFYYWPIGELESSLDDSLDKAELIIRGEYQDREITPINRVESEPNPPIMDEKDWPWEKLSLEHQWTSNSLKSLLK